MAASTENNVNLLGRLLLWQKLALVVAATAVPAVLLGCFYFQQTGAAADRKSTRLNSSHT